jgi:alpha/beta superfamily hydrolase
MDPAMHRIILAALCLAACATSPARTADQTHSLDCTHRLRGAVDAHYNNGVTPLAAAWIMPENVTRAPTIVIVQGSGTSDRSNAWAALIAHSFVRCGVAVLLTDKRGSGASGGSWRESTLLDLAGDAAVGLNWVVQQPGVDVDRVGYLGLSQGGQVAPAQTYRQHNIPQADIDNLQEMARASFTWLESGQSWDHYIQTRAQFENTPLQIAIETWPTEQTAPYWIFWRLNASYDPLPYWRRVAHERRLAALVVLGEEDARDNVDVATTARRLRETQGDRIQIEILSGVGHRS